VASVQPHKMQRREQPFQSSSTIPAEGANDSFCVKTNYVEMSSDYVDPDRIESMIAQEMAALSMEDREQVYYDIHGVKRSRGDTTADPRSSQTAESGTG
jgi:hypothetical protein